MVEPFSVSIRAPAGGAMRIGRDAALKYLPVSIRAPAGGAMQDALRLVDEIAFQSAPLREGRSKESSAM